MTDSDFKYLTEAMSADLAEYISKDFSMNIGDSLDALFNSDTYALLSDARTGLYFQSSLYVYYLLKKELTTGKIA